MKKLLFFLAACSLSFALSAQAPVNDDCAGLIDLGEAPVCPPDTFSNFNATASDIGFDNNPSCFNGNLASRDVWFAFTCPDTMFDFRITLTGVGLGSIQNPEFAIYRGDCTFDGLAELLCAVADIGDNSVFLDVTGLTPGLQYFIRVSDYSVTAAPNWGNFTLCVSAIPPSSNIDDGGSTLCSGTLYDSGGPDGDYSAGENNVFVICPNQASGCINFTLQYFNIEGDDFGGPDALIFYDGDNTSSPVLAQISGAGFSPTSVAGGGGVCFQVQATSGCLTVQFTSDGFTQFEGFAGTWECSSAPCVAPEQMSIDPNIVAQDIVDAISTPFTTVTITNIDCPQGGYGTFSFPTDNNQLGPQQGLLLTSGDAVNALGPNDIGSTTTTHNAPGDPDLDYLSVQQGNGQLSHDACIVELDVYVTTDELSFEYVFGSEEYPEYVNTNFNDIFAFLVSGPGIVGDPGLGGANNIAVLPASTTPVQINSVNNLLNWEYYRNTELSQVVEYDGMTSDYLGVKKSLTARTNVIPCNTYHLKLAIADRGDWSFDSGVFISDIKGGTPDINVQFASGIDYFIEDCSGTQDQLVISLSEPATDTTQLFVAVSGTATPGVDYVLNVPPVLVFVPGQQQFTFPIYPIADNIQEGTETIVIELSNNFGCGTVVYKTIVVNIEDNVLVSVNAGSDTVYVCAGSTLQLEAAGAVNYFWAPPGAVSNPFIGNPTITPTQNQWLMVTGTVASCVDMDSVFVQIIDPQISVTALADTNICQGTGVTLQVSDNVNHSALSWSPAAGLDNPNSPGPIAMPSLTTTYTATVTIAGCSVSDAVTLNVDTLFFPELFISDTTVCQNYPVQLAEMLPNNSTSYEWFPTVGLSASDVSGPTALPDITTTYTLTTTSANGYCSQTADVTVNVIAADINIQGDAYKEICLGDTVFLQANAVPSSPQQVQWSPAFYVTNPTGPNTAAVPDESVTILATYNVNGCLVRDSIHIRVDSLPMLDIRRVEDKAIYCPGDTVYLLSNVYEPASFPDISHEWDNFGTLLTPNDLWNLVVVVSETHTYERLTTNHGCTATSTVDVPVAEPPTITVTSNPMAVCPGEPAQINVTIEPSQTLEWDPNPTLSCADCPNPVATPITTTTYTVKAPEADCPAAAAITIDVIPPPALQMANNQTICLGESVLLNNTNQAGVTYTWTSVPAGFVSTEPTPTLAPTVTTTYKLVADNGSCQSEGEVTIQVADASINAGSDQTICQGQSATLSATTTGTSGTVQWQPGGQNGATINVSPSTTTLYTASLKYGEDCVKTDTIVVAVLPSPMLDVVGDTSFCHSGIVLLNSISEPGVTYSWTSVPAGFVSVNPTPTVTVTETTTYTITASNDVCDVTASFTVSVFNANLVLGPDQTVCTGDPLSLNATITGDAGTLSWSPGGSNSNPLEIAPNESVTYLATYLYGGDANCLVSDSIHISVIPGIELKNLSLIPDTTALCEGDTIGLSVSVFPPGVNLIWSVNGEPIHTGKDTLVSFVPPVSADNIAEFSVMATDANGCSATAGPISVDMVRCYVLPNAFTPDGDGNNDTFGLGFKGGKIEIVDFKIFSRWGSMVFEATPNEQRWNGKFNGEDSPSDVYVYVMRVRFSDGTEKDFKGDVTLIR